jgi:hypothetical protein
MRPLNHQFCVRICLTFLLLGLFSHTLRAQDDARIAESRIHELEDRVRRLEGMVEMLVEAQRSVGTLSPQRANLILADLSSPSAMAMAEARDSVPSNPPQPQDAPVPCPRNCFRISERSAPPPVSAPAQIPDHSHSTPGVSSAAPLSCL